VALENFGAREIAVWAQIDAKKSVRKLNKVKFQGFLGVCDFTFFTARAGERFKKVTRIWSDMVGCMWWPHDSLLRGIVKFHR
jgi:hypothetical protein